jgi:hypothetical protein
MCCLKVDLLSTLYSLNISGITATTKPRSLASLTIRRPQLDQSLSFSAFKGGSKALYKIKENS